MDDLNYDDPLIEERWCSDRREEVAEYLSRQGAVYRQIGEWPAWHVAPYVSIWAIESAKVPGNVGWWVICGDLPCDYISAAETKHPRGAMRAFATRWKGVAVSMQAGVRHPDVSMVRPIRQRNWRHCWRRVPGR